MEALDRMDVLTKVYLVYGENEGLGDSKLMFGQGVIDLLRGIKEKGSINQAAKELGMSYSKAWTLLGARESQIGIKLFESVVPRGTTLTPAGEDLIAGYDYIANKTERYARECFQEYLDDHPEGALADFIKNGGETESPSGTEDAEEDPSSGA